MTDPAMQRAALLSPALRRHFGQLFGGEPSMVFRPDGTVRVTVGAQHEELTAREAEMMAIPTCELQWELERRQGIQAKRIGIDANVEILIDGATWVRERGPLTVTVNQD